MVWRCIITGHLGQLGSALEGQLRADSAYQVLEAVDLPGFDITRPEAVEDLLRRHSPPPDVVLNAAAFTHVDRCEREPARAELANAVAPGRLAEACRRASERHGRRVRLVHVSTDYVFAGDARRPYREDDPTRPLSVYGRSKLEGERRVSAAAPDALIVRTSWLFGRGRNFIAAILAQARERRLGRASGPLRVVDDQHGRPTYAEDLAAAIRRLLAADARGLYHVANAGIATWWELARFCLDEAGFTDLEIDRVTTRSLAQEATRPAWSVLDCGKAEKLGVCPRAWQEAVGDYLRSPGSPLSSEFENQP